MRVLLLCICFCLSLPMLGYDLHNKALTPVTFQKVVQHEPLQLVRDGNLRFIIVTDRGVEVSSKIASCIRPAAEVLQEAFWHCTGKKPEIADVSEQEKLQGYPLKLVVGDGRIPRAHGIRVLNLPEQGFQIKSVAGAVIIAGYDSSLLKNFNADRLDKRGISRGTEYGAYDFVERFLGVRFFFPGEYGTVWPKITDLTIKPVHYTDYPRFDKRGDTYYFSLALSTPEKVKRWEPFLGKQPINDVSFARRWRVGSCIPLRGGHSPHPGMLAKAYPDKLKTIFYTTPQGRFCYNPNRHIGNVYNVLDLAFADLLVDAYKKYYDSHGKIDCGVTPWASNYSMSFGVCDTYIRTHEVIDHPVVKQLNLITPADIARDEDGAMSNVYGRFYQYLGRRLQKELPGKKLYILAYYNSKLAPSDPRWKLPENIEINLCDFRLPVKVSNRNEMSKSIRMFREWYAALGNRPAELAWFYNPKLDLMARAVAGELVGETILKLGQYLGRGQIWYDLVGVQDLWNYYYAFYAATRSQWNPEWNVDAGIDEHWELFYGREAGRILQEFHSLLKQTVVKYQSEHADVLPGMYPPSVVNRLESLLQKVEQVLSPGSVEYRRFRLFAEPWPGIIAAQRARSGYERPVYHVHQLLSGEKVTVDGMADENFWKDLKPVPLQDPRGVFSRPKFPAKVKLAWNARGIWGLMQTSWSPKTDQKNLWRNCHYELFFSPGSRMEDIYQLAFDSGKGRYSSSKRLLPIPQPVNLDWKPAGGQLVSKISAKGWTAEFFIPFSALNVQSVRAYDCWYFNLVHNKKAEPAETSGSALTLGINANIKMFGLIKFSGKGE